MPSVFGKAGALAHHNMTISEITVSPQHPCEVGWKVATIVMPTSQTKPGHRGRRESRGGGAQAGREGPWGRSPRQAPRVPPEPGLTHAGAACNTVTWTQGKDRGVKNKRMQRTKPKKVMQRGENTSVFFPSGQILSERVSSQDGDQRLCCWPAPHPQDYPPVQQFDLVFVSRFPQHRNSVTQEQAGRRREASSFNLWTQRTLPQLAGTPGDLWPHGPRCRHQGHTPQGKGFPALPTKAGWTVAGGWKEKGGGGGWQFPLACCCPCCVGGGWGPPGPGVCP